MRLMGMLSYTACSVRPGHIFLCCFLTGRDIYCRIFFRQINDSGSEGMRLKGDKHMLKEKKERPGQDRLPGQGPAAAGPDGSAYGMQGNNRRAIAEQGKLVFKEKKRLAFLGLPFTFTTYLIYENDIQIKSGFLSSVENDCYMYRVIDVQLRISFLQRLFGLGTVICVTSDATNRKIEFKNIRKARQIKDYIYQASEEAKLRRRTVSMQYIDSFEDLDGDGVPD